MARAAANDGAEITVAQRLLPFRSPGRRAGRHRHAFERATVSANLADIAAADKSRRPMIEIIAIELVDTHADRAGRDEGIEVVFVVVEETHRGRHGLMGEVAAYLALAGLRIIRRADARQQEKLDVEKLKGA